MIDKIKDNILLEIAMSKQLVDFVEKSEYSDNVQKKMILNVVNSLKSRIKLLNDSLPSLLDEISLTRKIPSKRFPIVEGIKGKEEKAYLKKEDTEEYLKQLNISKDLIKRLKRREFLVKEKIKEHKEVNFYGKLANKFFLKKAEKLLEKKSFKILSFNLKKSNLDVLTLTYISMLLFTVFLSFFVGIFLAIFFLFFNVGLTWPLVSFYEGKFFMRLLYTFWIPLVLPVFMGFVIYFYPNTERKMLGNKIDKELPFVLIHMSSVSGSGIKPSEIFKIIGLSNEYKYAGKEIRKILNQLNLYGYDLTTALRNVSNATPSKKLAEILTGISITVNSGGDINKFFTKRSQSLLLEYRLEREKYAKGIETLMDIYISIVIAAPMILLLLLIMISVSGIDIAGLTLDQLTLAVVGIVFLINILFLTFIHLKQPGY
jgi:pilus assembly protein TadC